MGKITKNHFYFEEIKRGKLQEHPSFSQKLVNLALYSNF